METQTEQATFTPAAPQQEHLWLKRLLGEWTFELETQPEAGGQGGKFTGTEIVRAVGDLWVLAENHGETPDGKFTSIITLGYDPNRQRYVGTFIGSMMTYMWVYEGELDASGRALVLATEGPDMFKEGATARYREVIEIINDNERTFSSTLLRDDGTSQLMMTTRYRRTK